MIVTVTVAEWDFVPVVAVMVTVYVPALPEQESVAVPEFVMLVGLIVHVNPAGDIVAERVTVPVKPLT